MNNQKKLLDIFEWIGSMSIDNEKFKMGEDGKTNMLMYKNDYKRKTINLITRYSRYRMMKNSKHHKLNQRMTEKISHLAYCPAKCKRTGMCYGSAWFLGKYKNRFHARKCANIKRSGKERMEKNCETCNVPDPDDCHVAHECYSFDKDECQLWKAKDKKMERGKILDEAKKTINGERQNVYGNPEDSFRLIAEYWTSFLKSKRLIHFGSELAISPKEVSEMMVLLKIARMSGQKPHKDNYVDAAGYIDIAGSML